MHRIKRVEIEVEVEGEPLAWCGAGQGETAGIAMPRINRVEIEVEGEPLARHRAGSVRARA